MKKRSLPVCIDDVATAWKQHISENVTINTTADLDKHVEGTHSVYHISMAFKKPGGDLVAHYAGMTGRPKGRISEHKSELKTCKTTTYTGKSALYCEHYFGGVSEIDMHFRVVFSGLTKAEAEAGEAVLAEQLAYEHGKEAVLTRPKRRRTVAE